MPMNSSLSSTLSEFTKKSDFSKSPLATTPSSEPRRHPTIRNLLTRARLWLGKLASFTFVRVLMFFVVGFAAGIAWQSYGGAARKAVAGWSPRLSWLAPAAAPGGTSPERIKAMSLAVATARQSLDKLATEISKLPAQEGNAPRRRASR
jgi:hypothetical protein